MSFSAFWCDRCQSVWQPMTTQDAVERLRERNEEHGYPADDFEEDDVAEEMHGCPGCGWIVYSEPLC